MVVTYELVEGLAILIVGGFLVVWRMNRGADKVADF